jgi:hypothetical protein
MSDPSDLASEKTYRPAEASLLFTSAICLAIAIVMVWVALGVGVPPWLIDLVCNLFLTGRHEPFRHFATLSAGQQHWLLLISCVFFALGAFRLEALCGLPRLVVTKERIALQTIFGTKWANWNSLAPFEVVPAGRSTRKAVAALSGQAASRSVLFWKKFTIPDAFVTAIEPLVAELNEDRAHALGLSIDAEAKAEAESKGRSGNVLGTLALIAGSVAAAILGFVIAVHH